jgi:hypothetical protein
MTASRLKNLAVAITLGLQSLSKLPRLPRLSSRLMLRMKILKTMVEVNQSLAQRIMSLTSVFWIIMRYIVFSFCSVVRIADIYVLVDIFSLQLRSQQRQSHSLQQGKPKHENRSARPQMSVMSVHRRLFAQTMDQQWRPLINLHLYQARPLCSILSRLRYVISRLIYPQFFNSQFLAVLCGFAW